jgi:hypothetical protein
LKERRYNNGQDPRVLDVVSIEMASPQPQHYQQENHLIDASRRWVKQGTLAWPELQAAVEDPAGPLWLNGFSSHHGHNDRVPEAQFAELTRSLYLVRPQQLRLVVASEGSEFGPPRRRVRAHFNLCAQTYCFAVTDPWTEFEYLIKEDGETAVDEALLCISLSERYNGYAYKLAATVLTPRPAGA